MRRRPLAGRLSVLELVGWRPPTLCGMQEEDDEDDKGFRGRLRRTLVFLVNFFFILGLFAQVRLAARLQYTLAHGAAYRLAATC